MGAESDAEFRFCTPRRCEPYAIDGHCLDEVRIRSERDYGNGSAVYTSFPVEHHHASEDAQGVTLQMPALTALQLYHIGVLSVDRAVELTVEGRKLGAFFVSGLRSVDGGEFGAPVVLRLERAPVAAEKPSDLNA